MANIVHLLKFLKFQRYGITKVESITSKGNSMFSFLPIGREKLHMIRLR